MRYLYGSFALGILLTGVALLSRPLLPIDETRYVSVAWEMHQTRDYLVSHLNGNTYAHKPPLLFWLINAVWAMTGVTEFSARIVAPLSGLCCLPMVRLLSLKLWPDDPRAASCAPLMLVSFAMWTVFVPLTMFDALLTLTVLVALSGILIAAQGNVRRGWRLAGLGLGLGVLAKGPVVLVHVLPTALGAFWWTRGNAGAKSESPNEPSRFVAFAPTRWTVGLTCAMGLAAVVALSWALPSAKSGGEAYGEELLFGQTAGRMVKSFAHQQSALWYLPLLPVCLMPWAGFGRVWKGIGLATLDQGTRFVLCWIGGSVLILSFVSGKQVHYLFPVLPGFALLFARLSALSSREISGSDLLFIVPGTILLGLVPLLFNHIPFFPKLGLGGVVPDVFSPLMIACGVAVLFLRRTSLERFVFGTASFAVVTLSLIVVGGYYSGFWKGYSVDSLAGFVANSEQPVLWYGKYEAELNFSGRISHLDAAHSAKEIDDWLGVHPSGLVVICLQSSGPAWENFLAVSPKRGHSEPSEEQQRHLKQVFAEMPDFQGQSSLPEAEAVFWIRRGLKKKPFVVLKFGSNFDQTTENSEQKKADVL